ncbi:MAG: quinolinate synthase NadA [Rhizobiales bacterium]|nr:quinolinate synthase NadA [Hyphomicrobiales bacterium]
MSIAFENPTAHKPKINNLSKAAQKFGILPYPDLEYTDEVARATAPLYEKVKTVIPAAEWPIHAPYIYAINKLKKQRNAVILAHNYMTPEIFHCVSDFSGDSLQLAIEAANSDADIIIQGGVHFMAETSKILAPEKTIIIPDKQAGCSLASSITPADIAALRAKHPGVPVVTYVNTSAAVKAVTDVCCTSSNALNVIESFGTKEVICIPDEHLANNLAKQTDVNIITFKGYCEVHDQFTAEELNEYRAQDPDLTIIAHPECPPSVVDVADFSGSTKDMIDYVKNNRPKKVMMVTECSMSDNVAAEVHDVEFIRPCNLCPHMKRITLERILNSLVYLTDEIEVDPEIAIKARGAVERMININKKTALHKVTG